MLAHKLPAARQIPQGKVNYTPNSKESPKIKDFLTQPKQTGILKPENTPQK
jgi:hypothetical protein